ncbi:MAG: FkbM family methyltransferase [Phycisphaerales bacterium]|nr:MAG: FkbM family methyltransferase [Phycisphaerales bacterium]
MVQQERVQILENAPPLDLRALRWLLRGLVTESERPSSIGKLIRGAVLVPVFGLFLILATVRAWLRRPVERIAVLEDGSRIRCRLPDLVQMYIYIFGYWEPDLTDYIRNHLREGDTFVDVGANVGYFSLLASPIVGKSGGVVAIEASPRINRMLEENIRRSDAGNVRATNIAAAAEAGTLDVYSGPDHNIGLTTTVKGRGLPVEQSIEALPLGEILTDQEVARAKLVKIDVEGGEGEVLAGLTSFLQRCPEDVEILVELSPKWWDNPDRLPVDVLKPMVEAGFNIYEMDNNYWPWRYLWPRRIRRPRRVRRRLTKRVFRLDLVLSRKDVEEL